MKHGLPLTLARSPHRGERSSLPHAGERTGERAG